MYKLGKINEAVQNYQKTIELQPNHAGAHNNLGVAYKELGENEKSTACYQKAIELQPRRSLYADGMALVYDESGLHELAYEEVARSAQLQPGNPFMAVRAGEAALALLTAPNPDQSGPELIDMVQSHLQVAGDAYLHLTGFETSLPQILGEPCVQREPRPSAQHSRYYAMMLGCDR